MPVIRMSVPEVVRPQYLRVRNYETMQHYKDRDPKWIKYHARLLDDYELASLPVPTRLLYSLLLLLAARSDNNIPYDAEWLAAQTNIDRRYVVTGVATLVTTGFLVLADSKRSASKAIAKRRDSASETLVLPRSREKRREVQSQKPRAVPVARPDEQQPSTEEVKKAITRSLKEAS